MQCMKPKRSYKRVTHENAVAMVRAYHLEGVTQKAIAELYGITNSQVCRIVHGDIHPTAYAEVVNR